MQERYITFNSLGKKIKTHYTVFNENEDKTILALHGIGSSPESSFKELSGFLPAYRIIAPSWIGFGKTDKLLGKDDSYNVNYCTDFLTDFINYSQKNGILKGNFHVLAKSMSAIPLASNYHLFNKNIEKIVFITPAGLDNKMSKLFSIPTIIGTKNKFYSNILLKLIGNEKSKRELRENFKIDDWREVLHRYSTAGYNALGKMNATHIIPEKFEKITSSILLISGTKDEIFPNREYMKFAQDNLWDIEEIQGAGHSVQKTHPQETANAIIKFLG